MVITLSGNDNPRLSSRLDQIIHEHVSEDTASLNLLELDGGDLTLDALRSTCDTVPFFGGTRLVIVKGMFSQIPDSGEDSRKRSSTQGQVSEIKEYLLQIPDSTVLVFLERRNLGASAAAKMLKSATKYEEFTLPTDQGLPAYIQKAASDQDTRIDRPAAALLAQSVADNPQRLEQELNKLISYAGDSRHITTDDVRAIVDMPLDVAVWDLTDALYAHDSSKCVRALRALIEKGQPPQQIIGAIASQLRNLIIAEDNRGADANALAAATGMKPFVARKSLGALRNFRQGEPGRILSALTELDLAYKTGKTEIESGLELLLTKACLRQL